MRNYCTIFDKNYLLQGITVYRSLKKFSNDFNFFVLCMDHESEILLKQLGQKNIIPIHVDKLNNETTVNVRARTTRGQYCWVCQPLICSYLLNAYKLDMITYLEADSMFFNSPELIFDELGENSVSVVPHRFTPGFDQTEKSGVYCVQFNAFKNDEWASKVLKYWKECCFLYDKNKPEFFPGQTYLDNWPKKFDKVKVIDQLGAGLAPWNVQQYEISIRNGSILVDDQPLVFYHYHQFCFYEDGDAELGCYPLTSEIIDHIYKPYLEELNKTQSWILTVDPQFTFRKEIPKPVNTLGLLLNPNLADAKDYYWKMKRRFKGWYNVYPSMQLAFQNN